MKEIIRNFLLFTMFMVMALTTAVQVHGEVEEGKEPGILGPPAVENGILYFIHWPDTLYAFDESTNEIRWKTDLDPLLDIESFDPESLPISAPSITTSFVIVHIGNQLWVVSKIDGATAWSTSNMPTASRKSSTATSNTLPGYYLFDEESIGSILTMEKEEGFWFLRRRMLGTGLMQWESRIPGTTTGWWFDDGKIWVGYEMFGPSGPGSSGDQPGAITCFSPVDGSVLWITDKVDGSMFQSVFRVDGNRLYITERTSAGDFEVRGFNKDSGALERRISYYAGNLIEVLVSGDKLFFLHHDGAEDSRQVKFHHYYGSLNPIKFQTLPEARKDQIFPEPEIDRNLFMYGGATYSVYDGTMVWEELVQREKVDWASDDFMLYLWDSAGFLVGFDHLTGQELWRTQFPALAPDEESGPHHGGAALELVDGRLFATTSDGEIIRVNPETGEIYAGVLRITSESNLSTVLNPSVEPEKKSTGSMWIWALALVVVILGGFFVWFGTRKPVRWDDSNGNAGF